MGGDQKQFTEMPIPLDNTKKAPANYHVSSLKEMKQKAKDHHHNFGMRGLSSDLLVAERKQHEA